MSISSVIGQDQAIDRLQQALASRRVPHAYIFHGPAGVGKELCARQFAKIILCENPKTITHLGRKLLDGCDSCLSCRTLEADTHPDYHLVYRQQIFEIQGQSLADEDGSAEPGESKSDEPAKSNKRHQATNLAIDVIREKLNKPAQLTSVYGRGKVFVVREIHLAAPAAQNALLKTLEEPPDQTVLILLADQLEGLLPTILSRSQMVMFGPLPEKFLREQLTRSGCDDTQSSFWARFTEGSLGRALWLAQQDWYRAKTALTDRLGGLSQKDPVELAEIMLNLAKAYADQARKLTPAVSQTVARQQMYSFMLSVVACFYRDVMFCLAGIDSAKWINADQQSAVKKAAAATTMLDASHAVGLAAKAETLIKGHVNANLVFEDLFGDLARISSEMAVG